MSSKASVLPVFQMDAIRLVEPGRAWVGWPGAVQRVKVEARRSCLQQLCGRHALPKRDLGLVEREVMIDELAKIREPGRYRRRRPAASGHALRDLPPGRRAELGGDPAWAHAREAERRCRRLHGGRQRAPAATEALTNESFPDDEVALRPVPFHAASSPGNLPRRGHLHSHRRPPSDGATRAAGAVHRPIGIVTLRAWSPRTGGIRSTGEVRVKVIDHQHTKDDAT